MSILVSWLRWYLPDFFYKVTFSFVVNNYLVEKYFETTQIFCILHAYVLSPGEDNGTPLQYSGLENPMDRGAWWAAVHGVANSRTWLSNFTFTFHFHALEKEMATHSCVLAWRIPGMGEPGGLPSMGSHRVEHDWSDLAAAAAVLSHVQLFESLWTIARQAPLSMRFSRQEYWSGFPCPPPGVLSSPGIEPASPALAGTFFTTEPPGKPSPLPCAVLSCFSCVWLFAMPWTVTHQDPRSMGILQAIIREWVAMPSSRGFFQPQDWTCISYLSCIGRRILYHWATWETLYLIPHQIFNVFPLLCTTGWTHGFLFYSIASNPLLYLFWCSNCLWIGVPLQADFLSFWYVTPKMELLINGT